MLFRLLFLIFLADKWKIVWSTWQRNIQHHWLCDIIQVWFCIWGRHPTKMFQLPEVPDFTVLLRKVAEKIGVSRQAVTKWETGTGIRYWRKEKLWHREWTHWIIISFRTAKKGIATNVMFEKQGNKAVNFSDSVCGFMFWI